MVERVALARDPAFDHDDRGVPAALGQRDPPLAEPFAQLERDRNAFKLVVEGILDHVEGQRALAAGDRDLEGPPGPGPAEQRHLHRLIRHSALVPHMNLTKHSYGDQAPRRSSIFGDRYS